jgi:hypothetical protein
LRLRSFAGTSRAPRSFVPMKRALVSFVCGIALIAGVRATELTADDYAIFHAAIQRRVPHRATYVWQRVEPLEALHRMTLESAIAHFPEARPVAATWLLEGEELDLRRLQAAANEFPPRFEPVERYAILDAAKLGQLVGGTPKENWLLNPALLPDAAEVCRLTRPVIREDGRAAFLVYLVSDESRGAIATCTLYRDVRDGRWRLKTCGTTWLTDWKDGKRVFEGENPTGTCCCR